MKILATLSLVCLVSGSIYPDGEAKEEWDARINAKIERRHKRDVTVKIPLSQNRWGQKLRLRVNQTAQSFPMGKFLTIQSQEYFFSKYVCLQVLLLWLTKLPAVGTMAMMMPTVLLPETISILPLLRMQ